MDSEKTNKHGYILGSKISATSYDEAINQVLAWAEAGESRYVCIANVHMVMEAYDNPDFQKVLNSADMATPDGMPLVWMLKKLGFHNQTQVCGPELTPKLCEAAQNRIPVGFYGASNETLEKLRNILVERYPKLNIAYAYSPPYRPLTDEEDAEVIKAINESGVKILFVGIGCPKQERWMHEHRGKVNAVMLGVGAAFDFIAGSVQRSPKWMTRMGIEWVYRLAKEPKRLWKRYFKHNPRYLVLTFMQLTKLKTFKELSE